MCIRDSINSVRKSGLTFAPEAGSQRMRDVINKNVTEEQLLHTVNVAFTEGWTRIKLYFMIGLPTETIEDVIAIDELGQKVVDAFYQNKEKPRGKGVEVSLSAAAFVPKPFTPFQWFGQDTMEMLQEKPVSYTHLDVYKRQEQAHRPDRRGHHPHWRPLRPDGHAQDADQRGH